MPETDLKYTNFPKTYQQIYEEFLKKTGIDEHRVNDFRSAVEYYGNHFYTPGSIIIWLNPGNVNLIYIPNSIYIESTENKKDEE